MSSTTDTKGPNGREMWLSFVKEYENTNKVTHAQAMASCSPLWADPKVKEEYYTKKYKALGIEIPKAIPKTRTKPKNENPKKGGRPKGTVDERCRKAKMLKQAEEAKDAAPVKRKSSNVPTKKSLPTASLASSSVQLSTSVPRKKRLTELEKKLLDLEERMAKMAPINDDQEYSDDSASDYSEDSDEEE